MDNKNKDKQEVKSFIIICAIIVALLIIGSNIFSCKAYAGEVLLAEAPINVGGNNGSSESSVIDISDGGSNEIVQSSAPTIIYAPDSSSGSDLVPSAEPGNDIVNNSNESNEGAGDTGKADIKESGDTKLDTGSKQDVIDDIYVPDSDDDCPVSDKVPLSAEVQQYIWTKCKKTTGDFKNYYAFILGAIQLESDFKRTAIHHNKNGTTDRGLMQINSCNISSCKRAGLISSTDDLWDIFKNIDCGFHEMDDYVKKFGVTESAYYAYNTGRQNGGSNKNSRVVMRNMSYWNTILFGEGC